MCCWYTEQSVVMGYDFDVSCAVRSWCDIECGNIIGDKRNVANGMNETYAGCFLDSVKCSIMKNCSVRVNEIIFNWVT